MHLVALLHNFSFCFLHHILPTFCCPPAGNGRGRLNLPALARPAHTEKTKMQRKTSHQSRPCPSVYQSLQSSSPWSRRPEAMTPSFRLQPLPHLLLLAGTVISQVVRGWHTWDAHKHTGHSETCKEKSLQEPIYKILGTAKSRDASCRRG